MIACRFAIWPTSRSPPSVKATIEGVVREPSLFGITTASPPSITATQLLVVPRSIPITFPIAWPPSPRHVADGPAGPPAGGSTATPTMAGRTSRSFSLNPRACSSTTVPGG